MKRRYFIGGAGAALMANQVLGKSKSFSAAREKQLEKGTIVHSVYFWLVDDISKEDEQDFLKFFDILGGLRGVKSLNYGKPAATAKREVVDHSYSYNLILTFDSLDDVDSYGIDPKHLEAANQYSKYWKRVQVLDTVVLK